jgi:hypothetical protein
MENGERTTAGVYMGDYILYVRLMVSLYSVVAISIR